MNGGEECTPVVATRASEYKPKCTNDTRCNSENVCVRSIDSDSTHEVINPTTGKMEMISARTATCLTECSERQKCTSRPGFGLQQRTRFEDDENGNRPAGSFEPVPTLPKDSCVFATGKSYECKIGMGGHFRCPVHGRRRVLAESKVSHIHISAD